MAIVKDLIVNGESRLLSNVYANNVFASSFKTKNGTANNFIKGDGSLDNNEYVLKSTLNSYLPLSGGNMTGSIVFPTAAGAWEANGIYFGTGKTHIGCSSSGDLGIYSASYTIIRTGATTSTVPTTGVKIGQSLFTFNNGNIAYSGNIINNDNIIETTSTTIATIAGVPITAKTRGINIVNDSSQYYLTGASIVNNSTELNYSTNHYFIPTSGIYSNSDESLKKNIEDVSEEDINKMFNTYNGFIRKFTWKESDKNSCGVIAQEIMDFAPEMINYNNETKKYGVNYTPLLCKMVGILFKKIKQQETEINELKEIIKANS